MPAAMRERLRKAVERRCSSVRHCLSDLAFSRAALSGVSAASVRRWPRSSSSEVTEKISAMAGIRFSSGVHSSRSQRLTVLSET